MFSDFSNFGNFDNLNDDDFEYNSNNFNNFNNCSFSIFGYNSKEEYIDCVIFEYIYITENSFDTEKKEIQELFEYGWKKGIAPLELANIIRTKTGK